MSWMAFKHDGQIPQESIGVWGLVPIAIGIGVVGSSPNKEAFDVSLFGFDVTLSHVMYCANAVASDKAPLPS